MASGANMALDGGDPRLLHPETKGPLGDASQMYGYTKPQMRRLHDSSISFEEYHYYAGKTRAEEDSAPPLKGGKGILSTLIPSKSGTAEVVTEKPPSVSGHGLHESNPAKRAEISDEEWVNASRALRTATASAIFYLITTDILGPFGLPYAFASMGWGYVLISA